MWAAVFLPGDYGTTLAYEALRPPEFLGSRLPSCAFEANTQHLSDYSSTVMSPSLTSARKDSLLLRTDVIQLGPHR